MIQPTRTPSTGGYSKNKIAPGVYPARLYKITYLGTSDTGFKNTDGTPVVQNRIFFTFEIPSLKAEFSGEMKPLVISSPDINFSFYIPKSGSRTPTLNTYIEALLGRQITDEDVGTLDINNLNGNACLIKVIDNKGYPKVETVMPLMYGQVVEAAINFPQIFDWAENFNLAVFDKMPEFIQKKIKAGREYRKYFDEAFRAKIAELAEERKALGQPYDESAIADSVNPEDIPF